MGGTMAGRRNRAKVAAANSTKSDAKSNQVKQAAGISGKPSTKTPPSAQTDLKPGKKK